MSFRDTAAEIEHTAVNDEDEVRKLIEESDGLLEVLELLNHEDRKELTKAASKWMTDLSARVLGTPLPKDHEARRLTQPALDHLFDDLQSVLFERWRVAHGQPGVYDVPQSEQEPEPGEGAV